MATAPPDAQLRSLFKFDAMPEKAAAPAAAVRRADSPATRLP
jgi:hypothetical protein